MSRALKTRGPKHCGQLGRFRKFSPGFVHTTSQSVASQEAKVPFLVVSGETEQFAQPDKTQTHMGVPQNVCVIRSGPLEFCP